MKQDMPEPWASACVKAGLVDATGRASYTALRDKAEIKALETVRALVLGLRATPSEETLARVSGALGVSVTKVARWAQQSRSMEEPYTPPDAAHRLTREQRKVLNDLIRVMAGPPASATKPDIAAPSLAIDYALAADDERPRAADEPTYDDGGV